MMPVDPNTFVPGMYLDIRGEEHIVLLVEGDVFTGDILVVKTMGEAPLPISKHSIRNSKNFHVSRRNFPSVWERLLV